MPPVLKCFSALAAVLVLCGCGEAPAPPAPRAEVVLRERAAVTVRLDRAVEAERLEALAPDGQTVTQRWSFTPGERRVLVLEPPPPAGACAARLLARDGAAWPLRFEVPPVPVHGLHVKAELPLGAPQPSDATDEIMLPVEADATLGLTIDAGAGAPDLVSLRLRIPRELQHAIRPHEPAIAFARQAGGEELNAPLGLKAGERFQLRAFLRAHAEAAGKSFEVGAEVRSAEEAHAASYFAKTFRVRCVRPQELAGTLRIAGAHLPADRLGDPDLARRPDTIQLPTRLGLRVRSALGLATPFPESDAPFTYQAIALRNDRDAALAAEVRAQVVERHSGEPAPAFALPLSTGHGGGVPAETVFLPPHAERSVPVPVYVRPGALPGEYVRRVEVRLVGSEAVVARAEFPLFVEQTDRPPLYLTLLAALISAIALPILLWKAPVLLGRFSNAELVLAALFGAASFVLVNAPSQFFATLLHALIPVFSPFLLGLWDTLAAAAIAGAVVVLVPRPGIALLSGGTRFLINGVLFGAFSPISVLMTLPSLLFEEAMLWLFGCTRGAKPGGTRWAVAYALIGVASNGLNLALGMALYRLYYADWYIVLYLFLNGLLYHAIGGALGARLGTALQRTAE